MALNGTATILFLLLKTLDKYNVSIRILLSAFPNF